MKNDKYGVKLFDAGFIFESGSFIFFYFSEFSDSLHACIAMKHTRTHIAAYDRFRLVHSLRMYPRLQRAS